MKDLLYMYIFNINLKHIKKKELKKNVNKKILKMHKLKNAKIFIIKDNSFYFYDYDITDNKLKIIKEYHNNNKKIIISSKEYKINIIELKIMISFLIIVQI